jgi:hypothetical protein
MKRGNIMKTIVFLSIALINSASVLGQQYAYPTQALTPQPTQDNGQVDPNKKQHSRFHLPHIRNPFYYKHNPTQQPQQLPTQSNTIQQQLQAQPYRQTFPQQASIPNQTYQPQPQYPQPFYTQGPTSAPTQTFPQQAIPNQTYQPQYPQPIYTQGPTSVPTQTVPQQYVQQPLPVVVQSFTQPVSNYSYQPQPQIIQIPSDRVPTPSNTYPPLVYTQTNGPQPLQTMAPPAQYFKIPQ